MDRAPGWSVRLKLTLSYAGLVMLAGSLLIAVAWVFALRWLPTHVDAGALMRKSGGRSVIVTGPSQSQLVGGFAPAAAVALVFLLLVGLIGGWLLAGRMLAPLTRITDATRRADTGSLSHRIELEGKQDEFRELADSFDAMLARLEAHVAEQQRFAANASHELRTPLAITRTLLEAARNDEQRDAVQLIDRLHVVNTRAIDLTEALLVLSRANHGTFQRGEVDLSLVAEEAAEMMLPLAEKQGIVVETAGEVAITLGSSALLQQLGTNLVHNAIVHNMAGRGRVWVTTGVSAEGVELSVENTGEMLTPESVATLTEPFQRGTERIYGDQAGVGLGLAIVKSIAVAHGGSVALTPRTAGGLCVTVRLPRAGQGAGPRASASISAGSQGTATSQAGDASQPAALVSTGHRG